VTRLSAAETEAALALLRDARMDEFAAVIKGRLECPDHGNTLVGEGGRLDCCVKGCAYEVAA
jgi:hypothetical protein